jgi:3-phosphoshikimate 1-carboxyvinyltransferase
MRWTLAPRGPLRGSPDVPGDKSIAHRCLLLGAVANGVSELSGMPTGQDVRSTAHVLRQLGVGITWGDTSVAVRGNGAAGLRPPRGALDCGNSGTTMRLLAGLLAGAGVRATLTGDASLRRRPMRRIAEPLTAMGVAVRTGEDGRPPIELGAGQVRAVTYRSPVASAQVKSCVLLAGLGAEGTTRVVEPRPTRDHTERMLRAMGAVVDTESGVSLTAPVSLSPLNGRVPGDVSSAAYWLAAASLAPGSLIELRQIGVNPGRRAIIDLLRRWGADILLTGESISLGEPRADLRIRGLSSPLRGGRVAEAEVPSLIDELPLLGLLAPFTTDGVEVRGAGELRVKESDRVRSTCNALRALGARVEEFPDGFFVPGRQSLRGGTVDAAGDHRIALGAAAISPAVDGEVVVDGAEVADVSYPGFHRQLAGDAA